MDAADAASELLVTVDRLRKMASKRQFPELLRVAKGTYRLRRSDYEAWKAARWTAAEEARAELEWHRIRQSLTGGA